MTQERHNSGILFREDSKTKETSPDWTGRINVGGVEYRLAAWIKQGRKGEFLSLAVSDFTPKTRAMAQDDDAEIPW